jgi:hypothetical protein
MPERSACPFPIPRFQPPRWPSWPNASTRGSPGTARGGAAQALPGR